jgi:hypothetical protein
MPAAPEADDPLFSTRWVHLFEADTAGAQVFVPETTDVPLSRRPRERLDFRPDGTASIMTPGPDDRPSPSPARWTDEAGDIVVRPAPDGREWRIVERTPARLVVQKRP